MPLFAHQKEFLAQKLDKSALVWSCGTGKTLTAIEWSKQRFIFTLVICPKSLRTNWENESRKYNVNMMKIMTKEEFRRDWKKIGRFDQVIVDEVHLGFLTPLWKSQMSKALKKYLEVWKIPRVLLLSATPYTSSPWNVYNLAYLLGYKWNWMQFRLKFFIDVRMGPRIVPMAKKGCEKELAKLVKSVTDVVDIANVMDVPLQYHCEPEVFALTPKQTTAIRDAYDPLPIVRYTKQHEIEQGFVMIHWKEDTLPTIVEYPSDKLERIKALVEENPKIAIVCRYNAQIEILADALKEYRPEIIQGATKDRHAVCERADKAEKSIVLIQADCAEGYQLPSFPVVVFASQSYSYVKWEQMCGRFLRMDKPSRTTFVYLLADGKSIDRAVYDAVKRKGDFKIELLK